MSKITLKPSLLQAEQSQLSQPNLMGETLQSLSHHDSYLESIQYIHISPVWVAQSWKQYSNYGFTNAE